jgi:hypothetical protein
VGLCNEQPLHLSFQTLKFIWARPGGKSLVSSWRGLAPLLTLSTPRERSLQGATITASAMQMLAYFILESAIRATVRCGTGQHYGPASHWLKPVQRESSDPDRTFAATARMEPWRDFEAAAILPA